MAKKPVTDITEWFKGQCSELPSGKLVQQDGVGLLEIMNSLEMGNVQMDTTLTDKSTQIFNPELPLTPSDICWIMDEMTKLEYQWWTGGTLCQTVFTSILYHHIQFPTDEPDDLKAALGAYTIAYVKCIDLAYSELSRGNVKDGEDCWLDHYGLSVTMEDPAENVLEILESAYERLNQKADGAWRIEILKRMDTRSQILGLLWNRQGEVRLPRLRHDAVPTSNALTYFDNVAPFLRQCMPLPEFHPITQEEALKGMEEVFDDLNQLRNLRDEVDWRLAMTAKAYRREMLPITRSIFMSTISPRRGERSILDLDIILVRWLNRHTGLPLGILDSVRESFPAMDRRRFSIWQDLLSGYLVQTITTPLLNPSRRRRSYMSLSFAWYERAVFAERHASDHPAFDSISICLHAARLDCLLEAALQGFTLDLISKQEERLTWWWIYQVTTARLTLQLYESWESTWARAWNHISAGMQALVPFRPITKQVFHLRFKWALKVPKIEGEPIHPALTPSYEEWKASERPIDQAKAERSLAEANVPLQILVDKLRNASCASDYLVVIKDLQEDLYNVDPYGKRRRWLPVS